MTGRGIYQLERSKIVVKYIDEYSADSDDFPTWTAHEGRLAPRARLDFNRIYKFPGNYASSNSFDVE